MRAAVSVSPWSLGGHCTSTTIMYKSMKTRERLIKNDLPCSDWLSGSYVLIVVMHVIDYFMPKGNAG